MASKLKTTLVLTFIGLFSSVSIWGVNELTKDVIKSNQVGAELGIYQELYENVAYIEEEALNEDVIERLIKIYDEDDTQIGTVLSGVSNGYGGEMTVLVAVDMTGTIIQVVVGENQETPNILGGLVSNYLPNLENQSLSDVTYDASTGATGSYNAIINVVNASRNLISGDPFLELISDLNIDADAYENESLIVPVSEMFVLKKDGSAVANAFTFLENDELITVFYENTVLIGVDGSDVLNEHMGEDILEVTSEDVLAAKILDTIKAISATSSLDAEFIFAQRPYIKEGLIVGTSYLGASLGFRDDNTFVVSFLEDGSLDLIENLVLSDTRSYFEDYVETSFESLYGTSDFSVVYANDAFAGASSTGASLTDILKEASGLIGGSDE